MKKTIYVTVLVILIIFFILFQTYLYMDKKTVEEFIPLKDESLIEIIRTHFIPMINKIDTITITTENDLNSKGSQKINLNNMDLYTSSDATYNDKKNFDIIGIQNMLANVVKIEITMFNMTDQQSILLTKNQTFPGKVVVKGANPGNINFKSIINFYYMFLIRNLRDMRAEINQNFGKGSLRAYVGPKFINNFDIVLNGQTAVMQNIIDAYFSSVTSLIFIYDKTNKKADRLDLYNGMLPVTPITLKTSYTSTM